MAEAHIGSILPIKNRVLGADDDTVFLAHYDLNEQDVLRGVRAAGEVDALKFLGAGMVETPSRNFSAMKNMSVEHWICWDGTAGENVIYCQENVFEAKVHDGNVQVAWMPYWVWVGSVPVTANTWTHIATTYDGETLRVYRNGVEAYVRSQPGTISTNTEPFRIGGRGMKNTAPRTPFNGSIHNLRIWKKTLSPEELRRLMATPPPAEARNLDAWWKMNEGAGNLAHDSSPFHNDGELSGNATWGKGNSVFTLRKEEGKFGGAIAVEEPTTNLFPSEVANCTGGISSSGSTGAIGTITYDAIQEEATMTVTDGGTSWGYQARVFYESSAKYKETELTMSAGRVEVSGLPEGETLRFSIEDYNGTHYSAVHTFLGNGVHENVHISKQPGPDVTMTQGYIRSKYPCVVKLRKLQLEQRMFPTSFVDGVRSSGQLSYNLTQMGIDPLGDWTISGWFKRHPNQTGWSAAFGIGNYYAAEESEFKVWTNHSGRVYPHTHDNKAGGGAVLMTTNAGELDDWFYLATTHNGATSEFHSYIWTKDRYVKNKFTNNITYPMDPTLYVGGSSSAAQVFNGLVDELRIDKVVRTEEELAAWYESNSPFWPRGIYRTAD